MPGEDRADVSGAARNDNLHGLPPVATHRKANRKTRGQFTAK
jgi:hypothetical protein